MIVTLLGATGRTGSLVAAELAARGHDMTALVRDPARLPDVPRLRHVVGDVRDATALGAALAGSDAVVSALGPVRKDPTLHRDAAGNLVQLMPEHGISRLVGISGAGIDIPGDRKSSSARAISRLIRTFGGEVAKDKVAEHAILATSELTWTLVRPPRLTDGPATGVVDHDARVSVRGTSISRADLASFVVDVLERDLYPGSAPFVAGR